jgi:hypothetical protein
MYDLTDMLIATWIRQMEERDRKKREEKAKEEDKAKEESDTGGEQCGTS